MNKEDLIEIINAIYEDFDIQTLHKFEYCGKDKNDKRKYKIKYTPMFMTGVFVDETIVEK